MAADRDDLRQAFLQCGVPATTAAELAINSRIEQAVAVVLYGSYARGDHTPQSDVDVLLVADRPAGTAHVGIANVSSYTVEQLAAGRDTLFGMHLARDAVVVSDTDSVAAELLADMGQPDPPELLARVRHLAAVLDGPAVDHLGGRIRVARYLLRTAVYIGAVADGDPCFSVRQLAERAGEPDLVRILSASDDGALLPTPEVLQDLLRRLTRAAGAPARDPHGGLRNLIVAEWYEEPARATLGVLVLAGDAELDYTALAKVIL